MHFLKFLKQLNKENHFSPLLFFLLCGGIILIYYLYFLPRGIVLYDEGYTAHIAERITQGALPYKDFFLQYPPFFFYFIALLYLVFTPSLLIGRIATLFICMAILLCAYVLLRKMTHSTFILSLVALFAIAAFGYPLLNIPLVIWPCVLLTLLLMLTVLSLHQRSTIKPFLSLGIYLLLLLGIKQNIGLSMLILVNIILFFEKRTIKEFLIMNSICFGGTLLWILIFFTGNKQGLFEFIDFNQRFTHLYAFSYPPLTMLFQPLGILKLLPYYLPIFFLLLVMYHLYRKKTYDRYAFIYFFPLVGFFVTIFPTSDLLHVYPYLGIVLVCFLIFLFRVRLAYKWIFYLLIFLTILSGFYLALKKEYYRYQPILAVQSHPLSLPKARGIFVDTDMNQDLLFLSRFLQTHTQKNDPILVYPFTPMLYFLFDRTNPSRYAIMWPGYTTADQEKEIIADTKKKHTHYIITWGVYTFDTPLSLWIQKQQFITNTHHFRIFEIRDSASELNRT